MNRPAEKIMPDFCTRRMKFHYITAINLLMKIGIDPLTIRIMADGKYENYKGEVHNQAPEPGATIRPGTEIVLHVGYSSAVDVFPYQFFYGFKGITDRAGDEWENNARSLMAPFDGMVVKYESIAHYLNLKYNFGVANRRHILGFLKLFDFTPHDPESISLDELLIWVGLMPYFNNWAGNAELVSRVIGLLFKCDVRIMENTPNTYEIPNRLHYKLGDNSGVLGQETIIGQEFTEFDSGYEVQIKNLDNEKLMEFLPGKPQRKKLDWILSLCMPGSLIARVKVSGRRQALNLGEKQEKALLGYASYL